jgi:hypothetical protein
MERTALQQTRTYVKTPSPSLLSKCDKGTRRTCILFARVCKPHGNQVDQGNHSQKARLLVCKLAAVNAVACGAVMLYNVALMTAESAMYPVKLSPAMQRRS